MSRFPWRLAGYVLLAILAVAVINYGLGYIPGTDQWKGKRAAAKVTVLESRVDTLQREATGQAEISAATDTYHTQTIVVREATAAAIAAARSDPDAETPLSTGRANRLRAHDRLLCERPDARCATIDPSRNRAGAVSDDDSPGQPDAG